MNGTCLIQTTAFCTEYMKTIKVARAAPLLTDMTLKMRRSHVSILGIKRPLRQKV